MKFGKKAFLEIVGLSILLLFFMGSAALYLDHSLAQENRLTARRLERSFAPLISKTHHEKDDLALQEFITALAQAPGVSFACVVDPEEKIIAHSRPNQIGKSLHLAPGDEDLLRYALKEESQNWGTLIFTLSRRTTEKLWLKSVTGMLFFSGILLFLYSIRLCLHAAAQKKLVAELSDMQLLLTEERAQNERLQQRLEMESSVARAALASVMNRLSEGAILLDAQQRVLMINKLGLTSLGLTEETLGAGCSWQDVPELRDYGTVLEQSLHTPGHRFPLNGDTPEIAGSLITELLDGIQLTWFMPRPALRVCR